jgi:hypothetical protein
VVSVQETKNNNSQEKEQQQRQIFIMFRSHGKGDYYSLKERYHRYNHQQEQQLSLYHLCYRFNAETLRTRTLCNLVHWIDWGTTFGILTFDDIAATIIQNKQDGIAKRLICKTCALSLAHLFTEQEQGEISRIYDDDDDDKKKKSQSRLLNQSQE